MRKSLCVLLVVTTACITSTGAAATEQQAAPSGSVWLQTALERLTVQPAGPPGASLLINRRGDRQHFASGVANTRTGADPTPQLHARIASMSKAYSGAVALELVARDRLRLADTVGKWLPSLLPRARQVTLRQALAHTSGLPDYIRQPAFLRRLMRAPRRPMPPRELLAYVREAPLEFRPGSRYAYSDTDNIVVGLMAEKATGLSYKQLLRRFIYRPLRLTETNFPRSMGLPAPLLHGYEVRPEGETEDITNSINPALAWASGGMVSTVTEVDRFFRAYVSGRLFADPKRPRLKRLIRRAHFRFTSGESSPPGPGRNYSGLGFFRYQTRCGVVFGHTGSFPGYRLFAASSADGTRSVVMFVNAQIVPGSGSQEVSEKIRNIQEMAVCRAL